MVFINTERRDRALAESLRDHVDKRLMVTLPIGAGKAGEIRADLNQKLQDCDALIVVYGDKTLAWVEKQLLHCNKIAAKRTDPLRALGVYDGPPEGCWIAVPLTRGKLALYDFGKILMNGCDQAHFVPTDVENGQLPDLIGRRKMRTQLRKGAKVVSLHHFVPMS